MAKIDKTINWLKDIINELWVNRRTIVMVSHDKGKLTMAPSMVSTVASLRAALSIFMKSPIWIDYTLIYVGNNTYLKK